MAGENTFEIDGIDYSDCIPRSGYTVLYEPVEGGQGGIALNGNRVPDIIAWKKVVVFQIMPLYGSRVGQLLTAVIDGSTLKQLRIFVPKDQQETTINCTVTVTPVKYRGRGIGVDHWWTGLQLTFREV